MSDFEYERNLIEAIAGILAQLGLTAMDAVGAALGRLRVLSWKFENWGDRILVRLGGL